MSKLLQLKIVEKPAPTPHDNPNNPRLISFTGDSGMTNRFGDTFHGEQWLYDVGGAASGSGIVIKKQTILGEPVFVSVSGHYNFEGTDLYLACHIHVLRIYKSSERFGEIGGYRRIHFDPNDRSQLACLNENERIVFHPANSFRADAGASKEVQALIQRKHARNPPRRAAGWAEIIG